MKRKQPPTIQLTVSKLDADGNKVPFDPKVDKRLVNEIAAVSKTIQTGTVYMVKGESA